MLCTSVLCLSRCMKMLPHSHCSARSLFSHRHCIILFDIFCLHTGYIQYLILCQWADTRKITINFAIRGFLKSRRYKFLCFELSFITFICQLLFYNWFRCQDKRFEDLCFISCVPLFILLQAIAYHQIQSSNQR